MSDDQDAAIKSEMRLSAMEYLLSQAFVSLYRLTGVATENVRQVHAEGLERLSTQTFPGLSPEMSDHAASELRDAVARLQHWQLKMLAETRGEKL